MKDLTKKQTFYIAVFMIIAVLIAIAYDAYYRQAKAAPQEYFQTIAQCQGLTKAQCVALLEQQVTTAKLKRNLMWEQRQ